MNNTLTPRCRPSSVTTIEREAVYWWRLGKSQQDWMMIAGIFHGMATLANENDDTDGLITASALSQLAWGRVAEFFH